MRWVETTASECRYGNVAERIFRDAEIIYENSSADWQGHANVFAAMPDGTFIHYEWTYGSCSGCDEWIDRSLSADDIEQEMRRAMAVLRDREAARRYLGLDAAGETKYPTANNPTNGSVPGMLRTMLGECGENFVALGNAFAEWEARTVVKDE